MRSIRIIGGKRLFGTVEVSGSKNAALPILFSTITTRGISVIRRVPDIGDVRVAISILESLGASVIRIGDTLTVDTRSLHYRDPSPTLTSAIRASTYLLGASLSRFGLCRISSVGGCSFSDRPIDMHLHATLAFGGVREGDLISCSKLSGCELDFPIKSVGATINSIIMAASAKGRTVISGHASEPHIESLIDFLVSAGASISFSEREIIVEGRELHGGDVTVIGDMIEAGSYLAAGLITGGEVTVTGCDVSHLGAFNRAVSMLGASVTAKESSVTVHSEGRYSFIRVTAAPYPAFPTDLQPIIAPLMARGAGGEIFDTVWTSRYGYLASLTPFGLSYSLKDGYATVNRSDLNAGETRATDLRGGMSALLCALAADGESVIHGAEIIMRGYERPELKLRSLGATVFLE